LILNLIRLGFHKNTYSSNSLVNFNYRLIFWFPFLSLSIPISQIHLCHCMWKLRSNIFWALSSERRKKKKKREWDNEHRWAKEKNLQKIVIDQQCLIPCYVIQMHGMWNEEKQHATLETELNIW